MEKTKPQRKLYRFRSNTSTIVESDGQGYVHIVWSQSYEYGFGTSFMYRQDDDNLIELSDSESAEVEAKIASYNTRRH